MLRFQLFHNIGGKRFEEVALNAGVAFAENGNVVSGMGVDFRDVFNKGPAGPLGGRPSKKRRFPPLR